MEEKKSTYRGYTEAQKRATAKYMKANYDEIRTRVPKGDRAMYQAAAAAAGISLNQFVIEALKEKIERSRLSL